MINHNQGTGEVFFPLSCNFTPTSPNFAGWAVVDQSQPGSLKWSYNQYQGWDPTKLPPKDPSTNTDFRPYWIDQLFDSGHIALTPPDLSTGTITCQTIGVWQINSPGSQPFTDSRALRPIATVCRSKPDPGYTRAFCTTRMPVMAAGCRISLRGLNPARKSTCLPSIMIIRVGPGISTLPASPHRQTRAAETIASARPAP